MIPVKILVNPGHGTAGVNSGTVPAIPGRLATVTATHSGVFINSVGLTGEAKRVASPQQSSRA